MAKATPNKQGTFSFFDDLEPIEPAREAKRHVLKPPKQIELNEDTQPDEPETKEPQIAEPEEVKNEPQAQEPRIPFTEEAVVAEDLTNEAGFVLQEQEVVLEKQLQYLVNEPVIPEKKSGRALAGPQKNSGQRGRRSVKENSLAAELVQIPDDEVLFQKQYYCMGEVTALFRENHSLIRYWASEFDILKPKKNAKGDRFFRPIDLKNLYLIYDLLRRRKFTIEGAKEYLKNNKKAEEKFAAVQSLQKIKEFFLQLKASL